MSKRKGLSAEEKKKKMLEIFHESLDFYQLKMVNGITLFALFFHAEELEKIAPKQKGVIAQSVKDVVQSLVDDGLVDTDKIGTSVYYWSYPSKTRKSKERLLEQKKNQLQECKKKLKATSDAVEKAKVRKDVKRIGREENEQRSCILKELSEGKSTLEELRAEKHKYQGKDPKTMKLLKEQTQIAMDAANRWIDNIFILKHWCVNRFNIEEEKLNKEFGIDPDLDYIK